MGAHSSIESIKSEYDELRCPSYKNMIRKNRSFENNVDIDEIMNSSNPLKRQNSKFKLRRLSHNQKGENGSIYSDPTTIYRKLDAVRPINDFFNKFFYKNAKKMKKDFTRATVLDDSDVNFSDLESLNYSLDSSDENIRHSYEPIRPYSLSNLSLANSSKTPSLTTRFSIHAISKDNKKIIKIQKTKSYEMGLNFIEYIDSDHDTCASSNDVTPKINNRETTVFNWTSKSKTSQELYFNFMKMEIPTLRNKYYTKLAIKNNFPTKKNESLEKNTFFIFDWDDTLICTSYITSHGILKENRKMSEKEKQIFTDLEAIACDVINYAIKRGHTYIITNAVKGWVEFSAQKFYPKLVKLLDQVIIISARGEYENMFPTDNKIWKTHTFLNIANEFNIKSITNIICIGDSTKELEASHVFNSKFENSFLKSIKFRENPRPEELLKELKLVKAQYETIYSSVKSLVVNVEKKKKKDKNSSSEN